MEISQAEVIVVTTISTKAEEGRVTELSDLQLSFVGGGIAEVIAG